MAFERKWQAVPARQFTANGTALGIVTIDDTSGFYTKSVVGIKSDTMQPANFQVLLVISPTQMKIGPTTAKIGGNVFSDLSAYTVADNATIEAGIQDKNNIPDKDHYVAVYESDPIVADRVIGVDKHGRFYDETNPVPGDVQVVDRDNGNVHIRVNADGSINEIKLNSLVTSKYDQVTITERTLDGDIAKVDYKLAGVLTAHLDITYDINGDILDVKRT